MPAEGTHEARIKSEDGAGKLSRDINGSEAVQQFSGIYPALVTPFTEADRIHEESLRRLVRRNLDQGVRGFYVTGSTGEAFLLSLEEREQVLEIVLDEVRGRAKVIAHVGCISTGHTLRLGRHAREKGADAVSAVPPYYYKFSMDEILANYDEVANTLDMPLIVYNIPVRTGVELTEDHIRSLRKNRRIIGIKHTSMNLYQLSRMKTTDPGMLVLNGHDEVFLGGLAMGCDGAIGSTFNFMADKFLRIREQFLAGNLAAAAAIQQEANEILSVLMRIGVMQGVKHILTRLGIDCGLCRRPFRPLHEAEKADIDRVIGRYL